MSTVYLLHLDPPYRHARHYVGFTEKADLEHRVIMHREGRGAVMLRHAVRSGSAITIARVWENATRGFEVKLKGRGLKIYCPLCSAKPRQTTSTVAAVYKVRGQHRRRPYP